MPQKADTRRLLLTQPYPERMEMGLIGAGYHCERLPLLATIASPLMITRLRTQLQQAHLVVVASPAAAHWLIEHFGKVPHWLPVAQAWYTPGSGTAALLQDWGITANYPRQQHNAAAMLALIPSATAARKLLWIGSDTSMDTAFFANMAIEPTSLTSHTIQPIDYPCTRIEQYTDHLWIISSKKALEHAVSQWGKYCIRPPLLVTSVRLGGIAQALGYTHRVAASTATKDLLAAIHLD